MIKHKTSVKPKTKKKVNTMSTGSKSSGYKIVSKKPGKVVIESKVTHKKYTGTSVGSLMSKRKKAVAAAHANGWKK